MAFTYFFRDAQTLETMVDAAIPVLRGQAFIHVWDAGCAHGPEPYTLAMLLRERMSPFLFRNVRIHATDVDPAFSARINDGVFPRREVQRISPHLFAKYFEPAVEPGCVRVVEELRARVDFSRHDLLSLVPLRQELSLIVCKNVLLHFEERQRTRVLRMFCDALRPDGLLAMEHTQKMPDELTDRFEPVTSHVQVFRKVHAAHRSSPRPAMTRLARFMQAGVGP